MNKKSKMIMAGILVACAVVGAVIMENDKLLGSK